MLLGTLSLVSEAFILFGTLSLVSEAFLLSDIRWRVKKTIILLNTLSVDTFSPLMSEVVILLGMLSSRVSEANILL